MLHSWGVLMPEGSLCDPTVCCAVRMNPPHVVVFIVPEKSCGRQDCIHQWIQLQRLATVLPYVLGVDVICTAFYELREARGGVPPPRRGA